MKGKDNMSVTTQEAKFLSVPEVVGISASQTSKGLSEDDLERLIQAAKGDSLRSAL